MKYLAKEIVAAAGKNPDEVIGKVSVNIAGVTVNKPDHIVNLQDATTASVRIGTETTEVTLPTEESEDLRSVRKARGEEATKAIEARKPAEETQEETPAEG
ncbi:MAG: hypothetical protein Tp172MES00d2C118482111_45 [Prokaryotic dsDNA virus sp.]|nr:MAG: hypothetical protein Tp172MES00d2C118482111_45 [Prokaryotic dsDNA virus sp.]|tara:strand:- start:4412 stop:4714 length:303 start_codon:yes stop_codon:yes gene_type:complete